MDRAGHAMRLQQRKPNLGTALLNTTIVLGLTLAASMATAQPGSSQRDSIDALRVRGGQVFATPRTKADGYGDGPMDPADPIALGGRPTLQNNGTYLRVNGLDAQTCAECHSLVSSTRGVLRLGIGGFGGISSAPMFMPSTIDVHDDGGNGYADFDGRLIVPPHLFGSGGVQLLANEMTADLQDLKRSAMANPGTLVELVTKGVSFGRLTARDDGTIDPREIEGIDEDLVVRPFGRKGEFSSIRQFDLVALQFHLGIQPTEVFGVDVDADGDGVANEISDEDVSALEVFITTLPRPHARRLDRTSRRGQALFAEIGCGDCHRSLASERSVLGYRFPEIETEPFANVRIETDLAQSARFRRNANGGLSIGLFSDLKRHDIGPDLKENFHAASAAGNREFVTAKLWGVGDSAPYLHDGRAQTLEEAIELHGGEARPARDSFVAMRPDDRAALMRFLGSLRLPQHAQTVSD